MGGVAERKEVLRHVLHRALEGESGATTRQSGRGYRVDHHRDHGSGGTSRGKQEVIEKLLRSPRARLAVRSNASRNSSSPKVRVSSCRCKAGDSEERQVLQQCVLHRIRRRRVQLAGPGPLRLLEPGGARLQSAGQPGDNPLIEAFNGRLRQEYLSQHWFLSLVDVQATLDA